VELIPGGIDAIFQLSVGDEKSIPALKINIFCDMAYSIPYLVPINSRNRFFPSHSPSKNSDSLYGRTVAVFIVPDWGDEAEYGVGLSYGSVSLCSLADRNDFAGQYDNPTP
jgi:hypothetical protein